MAKKLKAVVRLQLNAGKANPAPPVGPALAGHGINIMAFCKEYNARTQNRAGEVIPAEITVYTDGSFTFILKSSPASILLKKAELDIVFGQALAQPSDQMAKLLDGGDRTAAVTANHDTGRCGHGAWSLASGASR